MTTAHLGPACPRFPPQVSPPHAHLLSQLLVLLLVDRQSLPQGLYACQALYQMSLIPLLAHPEIPILGPTTLLSVCG